MKTNLVPIHLLPLDKSWAIRSLALWLKYDFWTGSGESPLKKMDSKFIPSDAIEFENALTSLKFKLRDLTNPCEIEIGESATAYRFLQFWIWMQKSTNPDFPRVTIQKSRTLVDREICTDPTIIFRPISELLKLDHGTSQWASAALIFRDLEYNKEIYENKFLEDTVQCIVNYELAKAGLCSPIRQRLSETIAKQANAILEVVMNGDTSWEPEHQEDFCLAVALDKLKTKKQWPSLAGHESNRLESIYEALGQSFNNEKVDSKDHRVVQAVAARGLIKDFQPQIVYQDCVSKSWPQFWEFLAWVKKQKENSLKEG